MRTAVEYVPRRAALLVTEALSDTRVVILNGARQVGKSTLAERVSREAPRWTARFLDDSQTRLAAQDDPVGFLDFDGLMLIDEVQRVPDLWLAIKNAVDRDPWPGRFILTGSARLLALQSIPDALPGRSETIKLWPLSQGQTVRPDDLHGLRYLKRFPDARGVCPLLRRRGAELPRRHWLPAHLRALDGPPLACP
ncbi:MAG: ATP-binding protein [Streptosporangiaceae bacterium]